MNNMAYSQMIGMGGPTPFSERMAGGMMSRMAGIGGPLASGLMGLAGLDPMSLGMKAGMAAWGGGGGLLGAGMAGMGAFGLASGGMALAGFAGNQMMMGGQQQAALNSALRGSFNFMNPNGTQGFSRSDMSSIGGTLRSMTHQFGPEGQVTSFGELSQLAANMGKMGMASGVRDAQDFSRKFREMITTLKSVAHELGTSLEEAQQFMSAQRSSGIFKTGDQSRFASMARGTALSGGLALSEVTGMASIGSQIARSVGGLGRQGAFGGMRAIGQVGSAMQVGALSEEDIYNATGLTGAEGRQAMASNMMAGGAQFLKSSRGRYFLASMAGRNGSLDEESVANWMAGGMDVGETKAQANRNLSRVGRANFIRNEGRLRGSVLERFGALAPTMAYQQWLSSKGYDPTSMDDKAMLAFQRFSGMGRDEADNAIAMVQKLPEMLAQQRQSGQDDRYSQQLSHYRSTHGIEGLKNRFKPVREGIQGKFQRVGQDIFNTGSDMLEQWFNGLMGTYERRLSGDIDEVWRNAKMGGRGTSQLSTALRAGGGPMTSRFGGGGGGLMSSAYDRSKTLQSFAEMGRSSSAVGALTSENRDWLQGAYTSTLSKYSGEKRMRAFGQMLEQRASTGDKQAQALLKTWQGSEQGDRAGLLAAAEREGGISSDVSLGKSWQLPELGMSSGLFRTVQEGDRAVGAAVLGSNKSERDVAHAQSFLGNTMAGKVLSFLGARAATGDTMGERLLGTVTGEEAQKTAIGAYARSAEGASIMRGLVTGDKSSLEAAQKEVQEINVRGQKGELSARDEGVRSLLQQSILGMKFDQMPSGGPGMDALLNEARQMTGKNVTLEDLKRYRDVAKGIVGAQARDDIMHLTDRARDDLGEQGRAYAKMGLGTLNSDGTVNLNTDTTKGLSQAGMSVVGLAQATINMRARLGDDPTANAGILEQIAKMGGEEYDKISKMSLSEKKAFARRFAGTQEGSMAGESLMREQRLSGLMKHCRGAAGGIASLLGVDLTKEEMEGLKGKDAAQTAAFLAQKKGITDEAFQKDLASSIQAAKGGQVGQAADILNRGISQSKEAREKLGGQKKDPQEEVAQAVKEGNKFLKALVDSNKAAVAALAEINAKTDSGNAEDKKK